MMRIVFILCCLLLAGTFGISAQDTGRLERSELRFLEGMSDHHQMALDMAGDCLAKASTPAVVEVCQAVIEAQSVEIEQMRVWLLEWYYVDYAVMPLHDLMETGGTSGMDDSHTGHGTMDGPATDPAMMMGMFAGFNRLEGADYEIAWLESMIDHHDDAIHMSERLLERGVVHPELGELAQAIIDAQTAEIAHMEALLAEYF